MSRSIDRMLVVIFDRESKAYEGRKALFELEDEGSIIVYADAVVARNADGAAMVREGDDPIPVDTVVGTALGALVGLLGGPVGAGLGAAVGLAAGGAVDVHHAAVGEDFVEDVRKELSPEKFALIAEIQEEWTEPVDTRMEAIGGKVFRRALSEVGHLMNEEDIAAMRADLAQMKAEHAQAHADRKGKLQEKIIQLDSKIQAQLEKSKERRKAAEAREKAKVEFLKVKATALKAKAAERHV